MADDDAKLYGKDSIRDMIDMATSCGGGYVFLTCSGERERENMPGPTLGLTH